MFSQSDPVAVADTGQGYCGHVVTVDVLNNDYHPQGAMLEIKDAYVYYPFYCDDPEYVVISNPNIGIATILEDGKIRNCDVIKLRYRVQEVDNPYSFSNWAEVVIGMQQNPDYPVFNDDEASTIAGYAVTIDVLANDELAGYDPDLIHGWNDYGYCDFTDGKQLVFTSFMTLSGNVEFTYKGTGGEYISYGNVKVEIEQGKSYDSVNINNINAGINSDGYLFSREKEAFDYGNSDISPHFEFPKGSGKNTIFASSLWIGAVDQYDSLHLAAQRYKQVGYDFQAGPVSDSYDGVDFFRKWNRVWKISKDEITYHRNNYWKENYEPVDAILNWPANGNVLNGQAHKLAPFFDSNGNEFYEPLNGDYPLIRGDQAAMVIFNDDKMHGETGALELKVEIHGMLYSYDNPDDSLLNNTVFMHYDIYNRSENTYYNTYVGSFTDMDIGYAYDDYIACHVELGSFYQYNGKDIDGNGEPNAYGELSPAQGVTFMAGPFMDDDGYDNPAGGCDYSVNGLNFGDDVVDNERYGMVSFVYYNNTGTITTNDPDYGVEYYNSLQGLYTNGLPMTFMGPVCRFIFPGDSDPLNWGTNGLPPGGGFNQNGKYWTEELGNNETPNYPGDRRGLGASGPFTFKPGDRQEVDLAFSVNMGNSGPSSSVDGLIDNLSVLADRVDNGQIVIPANYLDIDNHDSDSISLMIYPNPVKDLLHVDVIDAQSKSLEYSIYNTFGRMYNSGTISGKSSCVVNVSSLPTGVYLLQVSDDNSVSSYKFVKM